MLFLQKCILFFQKAKVGICSKYLPKVKRNICTFEKKINVFPPQKKEKLKTVIFVSFFLNRRKKFNHITKQCEIQADIVIIMDHYFKTHHHLSKREIEQG